ncbi:hypothetical protein AAH978_00005 [Streptomyces sp. ZYX-F-203]
MAGVEVAADVVGLLLSAVEEASSFAGEVVDTARPPLPHRLGERPRHPPPRGGGMTLSSSHVRLLSWTANGKPAYIVTDGTETFLSRLADTVEEEQVESATTVRDLAEPMIESTPALGADELRRLARRLLESLTDVLNVAECRAQRIPPYRTDA